MKNYILILFIALTFKGFAQNAFEGLKKVNGTSLYVKIIGNGEPLLVIHGGPVLDHSYFLPHFKELAKNHTLIFYDQRASGRSLVDVDSSSMAMETFVEDIEALRKKLNIEKWNLLGHSWGGLLSMEYAVKYPQNLNSLILVSTMAPSWNLWKKEQEKEAESVNEASKQKRKEILESEEYEINPSESIERLLLLSFESQLHNNSKIENLAFYIPKDYQERSKLFGNLWPYLSSYDLTGKLKTLNVPILLIYGEHEVSSEMSGKILLEILPNVSVHIIPKSGHFSFMENPSEFKKTINLFLMRK